MNEAALLQLRDGCLEQIRRRPDRGPADRNAAFTAMLYAVFELQTLAREHPLLIDRRTVSALDDLFRDERLGGLRQSLFLFREAADTLCALISAKGAPQIAEHSLACLENVLRTAEGPAHRAVAEALGALPFSIPQPEGLADDPQEMPRVAWREIVCKTGRELAGDPIFIGRSLVAGLKGSRKVLALKLARPGDAPAGLAGEALWMDHLRNGGFAFKKRFDVPIPLRIGGNPMFRVTGLPVKLPGSIPLHPERYAIAYTAPREYFSYPNGAEAGRLPGATEFAEVLSRNAYLLGKLAGVGIVHEAPIPLFHNRVQQERRRDQGRYEWFRAGRLDQWLASCDYPNLGPTGLRDFEHLALSKAGGRTLYRQVGTHLLSLLLVAGSYFRNRNRRRVGFDPEGRPVDARDLFDPPLLQGIVLDVFREYYQGFTGAPFDGDLPLDPQRLTQRMIEEMGVDRHMEEIFRVADQNVLSDRQFAEFLARRGFPPEKIGELKKGAEDIVIHSGPHLGGFNDRISLPELIAAVETMSAVCVCGRHLRERGSSAAAA
jgi:hypothetical protein